MGQASSFLLLAGGGKGAILQPPPKDQWGPIRREGGERAPRGVPMLASIPHVGLGPEAEIPGTEQSSSDLLLRQRTMNKHPLSWRFSLDTLTSGPPSVPRKSHHTSQFSDNSRLSQKSILLDSQQATGVQGCLFRSLLAPSLFLSSRPFLDHCQPLHLTSLAMGYGGEWGESPRTTHANRRSMGTGVEFQY